MAELGHISGNQAVTGSNHTTQRCDGVGALRLGHRLTTLVNASEELVRIKQTIIAPLVMTIGSAGILAGAIAPIVTSTSASVGVVTATSASPNYIYGA